MATHDDAPFFFLDSDPGESTASYSVPCHRCGDPVVQIGPNEWGGCSCSPLIQEITAERWMGMLEVLPPMEWVHRPGYTSFLMCEMAGGPYTEQYVRIGEGATARYYTKTVNAHDRATWIEPAYTTT